MTQQLDDLTKIKGIGTATAGHLVKAGISTFALLAASSVEALGKVEGLPAMKAPEWPAWIEEAGKLAAGGETGTINTTPSESPKGGGGDPAPAAGARYQVSGPKAGRWRAGLHFTPEARTIEVIGEGETPAPDAAIVQVDETSFARIKADPALSVRPA